MKATPPDSTIRIPFNRPYISPEARQLAMTSLQSDCISGNGDYTRRCQQLLRDLLGAPAVLLTTSCTDALEMAAILLDLQPGDEVLVPSFTFVSTANAFVMRGAVPRFVDIDPQTLNIDPQSIRANLSARSRCIVPVHYGGVSCDMDAIVKLAEEHRLDIVEDNAHGLCGTWRGRQLGTIGRLATLSFHETKNITCGEGGALIINDAKLRTRAEIIWEKGTNRAAFNRGEVDKYTWYDTGSSFLPSDLLAAILCGQLTVIQDIQAKRQAIWQRYHRELAGWARQHGVQQPFVPEDCVGACHLYHLVLPTAASRDALIRHLRKNGILAVFHYVPLHASPFGRQLHPGAACPVAESVSARLLRLPFYTGMTSAEQAEVIEQLLAFQP